MNDQPLLEEALDLSFRLLEVDIELKRTDVTKEDWTTIAFFQLVQSRKILLAIYRIIGRTEDNMMPPADVLVRTLFEIKVRLKYMQANPDKVSEFSEHHIKHPTRPWRQLKDLCESLGLQRHYDTLYRETSQEAHGGISYMKQEILRLLGHEQIADWNYAKTVATALAEYVDVININLRLFPDLQPNFDEILLRYDWSNRFDSLWCDIWEASSRESQ